MKRVAVINDLSGFGNCSLTAAIPVLAVMGVTCHPVVTATLTEQTAYPDYHCQDLTSMIPKYIDSWSKSNVLFDGIYTGFMTCKEQIEQVLAFVKAFQKEDTILLVDPVLGDDGQPYLIYADEMLTSMKQLTGRAQIITPNLTEACMLTGNRYENFLDYTTRKDLMEAVGQLGQQLLDQALSSQEVVITGLRLAGDNSHIYNLLVRYDKNHNLELLDYGMPYTGISFSGTGDLFSSILCGGKMRGMDTFDTIRLASEFLYKGITDTMQIPEFDSRAGIHFERHLEDLL